MSDTVHMRWIVLLEVALTMVAVATGEVGFSAGDHAVGLPLSGKEAVEFLRLAEVVGEPVAFDSVAITEPVRVTMTDGNRTLRAIFKDENVLHHRFRFGDGREVDNVRDSYKHEIAAFELATLLGLDLVPPCVERSLFRRTGSLCLWVEGAITEAERRSSKLAPENMSRWNRTLLDIRLFHQLTQDLDFTNIRNLVVDADFRIYKVDSSMAFHADPALIKKIGLTMFSRNLLEALTALERPTVEDTLGPWLTKREIDALWRRRGRILEFAQERVAELGERPVLY